QAEDGIRDKLVTGVQTCALPILELRSRRAARRTAAPQTSPRATAHFALRAGRSPRAPGGPWPSPSGRTADRGCRGGWRAPTAPEIGRASCRERGQNTVGPGVVQR